MIIIHSSSPTLYFNFNSSLNLYRNSIKFDPFIVPVINPFTDSPFVQMVLIREMILLNLVLVTCQFYPFCRLE